MVDSCFLRMNYMAKLMKRQFISASHVENRHSSRRYQYNLTKVARQASLIRNCAVAFIPSCRGQAQMVMGEFQFGTCL